MKVKEPITEYSRLDLEGTYTYLDYLRFQFKERVELFRGKVIKMSPAPNTAHQTISLNLGRILGTSFYSDPCKVFFAPFDVRLFPLKSGRDKTVVQPDLCVVCDPGKLDEHGCVGVPDLVMEVLSPGNTKKELGLKFDLYQEAKVREYWIIDPVSETVLLYELENGKFKGLRPYVQDMVVESVLFPQLKIKVEEIFYRVK